MKKSTLTKLLCIVISIILIIFATWFVCFRVIIFPKWCSFSLSELESVKLSNSEKEIEITNSDEIKLLYDSINKNKIKYLKIAPSHNDNDSSDAGYIIVFEYKNGKTDNFRYGGIVRNGLTKNNSDSDSYWIVGEQNKNLTDFLSEKF